MPVTLFLWAISFVPIALLIVLLVFLKHGVVEAAGIGLSFVVLSGILVYKGNAALVISEGLKGVWSALMIIYIIWAAILLYQTGGKAGAFTVIRNMLQRMLPNELLMLLAMGWILESFLQGITGFGVPVAVGAPLLIAVGVDPVYAVVIPLLGQAWGNTYGTLGAAWDSLVMTVGLVEGSPEFLKTALWTAVLLMAWNYVAGFVMCWLYGGFRGLRKGLPAVLILGAVHGVGEMLLSQLNTTLACFIPAVISLGVIILLGKTGFYKERWLIENSPLMKNRGREIQDGQALGTEGMNFLQAFLPYIFLSVMTLCVLLITPIREVLGSVSVGFAFPETSTGYGYVNAAADRFSPWSPLTHAGTFLLASALAGMLYYRIKGWLSSADIRTIFCDTFSMVKNSAIATAEMVAMAKIMSGTGQTEVLAQGIAGVMGRVYFLFAPMVGYLGTFITGSNVNSNVLFGGFQHLTANLLNADPALVLSGSTVGASVGSAVSPGKIILGAATAGVESKAGEILKIMLCITLPAVILIGLCLYVMIALHC